MECRANLAVFTIFILSNVIHARSKIIRSEIGDNRKNPTAINETGFKIDLQFDESDYEMIQEDDIKEYQIADSDKRFQKFNEIAKEEHKRGIFYHDFEVEEPKSNGTMPKRKGIKTNILAIAPKEIITTTFVATSTMSPVPRHHIEKKSIPIEINYDLNGYKRFENSKTNKTEMKIDPFITKLMEIFEEIGSLKTSYNCTEDDLRGIGFRAIKCTISQFGNGDKSYKDLAMNLIEIAAIWLFVYLLIAVPLWCTKGWGSYCLCCKFFKPQQTIQEAKNYLLLNPPGTLVTKKGGIIHYESTEREKDCYEEFGHFIRTL